MGVVERVNREEGTVAIRHEAIQGFMPAMTMPFALPADERPILDDLQPGDKVEGTLVVSRGDSVLTGLEIVEMALAPEPSPEAPRVLEPGQEVPDFAMTTQEGKPLRLSDLRGEVVVLTFIYTRCPLPNFCPLMDRKFADLARMARSSPGRADRVRLLSVSFDPEHDTPAVLSRHARTRGAEPPLWTFAVAEHEQLRKILGPLGLFYGPREDDIMHNLVTVVIDPEGRAARIEWGGSWDPRAVMETVVGLVRADPRNGAGRTEDGG